MTVIQNVIKCIADQKWHELDYAQKTDYQSFQRIREELSVVNGLLLRDERIVSSRILERESSKISTFKPPRNCKNQSFN